MDQKQHCFVTETLWVQLLESRESKSIIKALFFGGGPPKCGCEAEYGLFFIEFFLLTWYETEMSCLTGLFGYSGLS